MKRYCFTTLLLVLCLSCSEDNSGSNQEELTISVVAENYLNEVLDIMETNSLNRNIIDWSSFRNEVFELAGTSQTIGEVYSSGAILRALALLGDNHSFIQRENGEFISASTAVCPAPTPPPGIESIPDNIGYIFVLGFNGRTGDEETTAFAENLQNIIREKDAPELLGWIVDLRPNTGGNMFPMLAGIGPILGEGIAGYFIGPNGDESSWSYSQGTSFSGQVARVQVQNSYTLFNQNPKVAVLLNVATASSGEAIAISFINRDNTTSFGTPTCGLSSGNNTYLLSDNSTFALTEVVLADRQKNTFGGKIQPDVTVNDDEIIASAITFIQND
ncbi:MAG: S41 family peptidase [Bacteroidota bacterium]